MSDTWQTVEEAAADYVSLMLDKPRNGWGQHVHPIHGPSHSMLYKIGMKFGPYETEMAVDAEFAKRREQKKEAGK